MTDDYASAKIDAVKQLDKMYKKERNQKVMKSISDSMEEYVKEIHENDLQEMRINPKKKFTNPDGHSWANNYALEA